MHTHTHKQKSIQYIKIKATAFDVNQTEKKHQTNCSKTKRTQARILTHLLALTNKRLILRECIQVMGCVKDAAAAAAADINFYNILERNVRNSKSHEKHIYSCPKIQRRRSYTTDVYDKPFYFIVATNMNFYSCNLIMGTEKEREKKKRTKNRDPHFTYIGIACPLHQLSVDDYSYVRFVIIYINVFFCLFVHSFVRLLFAILSVALTLFLAPVFVVVVVAVASFTCSSFSIVCMLYMSLFVCTLLCSNSFYIFFFVFVYFFLATTQVNARKLNENIKFGCITNKGNLRIYQVYGHKI